jgi:O-antigen/teichoic acid export membrane protein
LVKSNSFFEKSKNLSLVGIGNIISNSISSLFWIFIASILSTEEYGELGFLLAIVSTISAFALIGSNNVLTVYVAKKIKIQATIFLIALITGFISSIGLLIFTENIFISFYPLGVIVFSLIIYDFLGKKLFLNYAKYMILQRVIMVGLSVILYHYFVLVYLFTKVSKRVELNLDC